MFDAECKIHYYGEWHEIRYCIVIQIKSYEHRARKLKHMHTRTQTAGGALYRMWCIRTNKHIVQLPQYIKSNI